MNNRSPTKVLMVEVGGWGGICHYAYNLSHALAEAGVHITLVSGTPYELAHLPRSFQLEPALRVNASYRANLSAIGRHFKALQPDILHIQSTMSARRDWLALALCKLTRCPTVFTAHNMLPHDAAERNAPGMRLAFSLLYALSDRVIVHGVSLRQDLVQMFGLSYEKIAVIPHGDYTFADMGPATDTEAGKQELGLLPDDRLILAFGAIREYKGIPDLIEAFARLSGTLSDVKLAIVGKPIQVDIQRYRDQVRRLGIQDRVVFRPEYVPVEAIARYFQAADIAAFPYRSIAQSGALQLAYAFAKPVVATRVGAFPETVAHGRNGLLVPPRDPVALAEALTQLLTLPPEDLRQMGRRSRELAGERYTWTEIARKTSALYSTLLSAR